MKVGGISRSSNLGEDIDGSEINITNQAAGDILYYNGTAWVRLAKGSATNMLSINSGETAPEWVESTKMVLVASETLASNSTDFTRIQSLDFNGDGYSHYIMVLRIKYNASTNASIYVNNDTTATNYYSQTLAADNTSVSGSRSNSSLIGPVQSPSAFYVIYITRTPNGSFHAVQVGGFTDSAYSSIRTYQCNVVKSATITNITDLQIKGSGASGFAADSTLHLYGVKT